MSNQYVDDLIGSNLGDYTLQELVGEGTFSYVLRGVHKLGQIEKAFKVPRPYNNEVAEQPDFVPTQVFVKKDGKFAPQEASPVHLLRIQIARTKSVMDQGLVEVEDYSIDGERRFSRMPLLTGVTFRQYLKSGPVPISVLRNIALTLARLNRIESFGYHGDVKPENMIVTNNGVTLVDCGYFGSVTVEELDPKPKTLVVTTPRYYPHLQADDLLAFGLLVWEAACRKPLLEGVADSQGYQLKNVSPELVDLVKENESCGNFYFSPILAAEMPSEVRPGLPARIEAMLLKAVRLKVINGGKLAPDEGFENFEEFADDLKRITQEGVHYL
ncbi:MAG: hypothetical protein K2Z81_12010 [Cyanobacteria bacterium]|nr:hypothetical protein [Cyanobacteriota bacterium]